MDGLTLLQDLAVVLLAAGIAGLLCRRVGLSVIVGYLLAGVLIGPYTPPFSYLQDLDRIHTLSQLGLVFLMFAIGLGLSLSRLGRLGPGPIVATALAAFLIITVCRFGLQAVGFNDTEALFVAAMLTVSSSAVIAKMIEELRLGHERFGQLALSVTVLEDIVAVVVLTVLGAEISSANASAGHWSDILAGLTAFVVLLIAVGLYAIPRVLRQLEVSVDRELLTILVSGFLLLSAVTTVAAGYSLALGAFLLGAMIADTPQRAAIDSTFRGLRDVFSSVFFVAIGMLIDVRMVLGMWPWILALTVATLVVRFVIVSFSLSLVGVPDLVARRAGLLVVPVGEFSFIIAQLGVSSGVLEPRFYPLAVGVSLLTVILAPILNRSGERIAVASIALQPSSWQRMWSNYQNWMARRPLRLLQGVWWKLVRRRILQVTAELLLVAGVLGLAPVLQAGIAQRLGDHFSALAIRGVFWSGVVLLLAVLLTALWRNLAALSMITSEALAPTTRLPKKRLEMILTGAATALLALWVFEGLPWALLPRWSWFGLAALLLFLIGFYANRLVHWHSHWLATVHESLSGGPDEPAPPSWHEQSRQWGVALTEIRIPENSAISGQTLGELEVRKRFACSIAEINRQGHTLVAPGAGEKLYSGDRLLLLGNPQDIEQARASFCALRLRERSEFDDATLDLHPPLPPDYADRSLEMLLEGFDVSPLIVGVEREGERQLHPPPTHKMKAGDRLLVLGNPTQHTELRRRVTLPISNENTRG
ncbi:MAG: cation:proton antiporter [Synoicihabitans sp.]